jgi:hypothetical protein
VNGCLGRNEMKKRLIKYLPWLILFFLSFIITSCIPSLFQFENPPTYISPNLPPIDIHADSLVKKYGWDENLVTRWPNGIVEVFDMTGYPHLQEVLNKWNEVIGGPTSFYLSLNPLSPIIITVDYSLNLFQNCGYTEVYIGNNSMIYGATIFIFPDENLCPVYATLLHEFGHVVGFGGHTSDGCVMDPINLGNTHLSESVLAMVHRLYQLPIGSYLP